MKPGDRRVFFVAMIFFLIIILASVLFSYTEDLNVTDSLYFNVITATTIGYGDIVPTTDSSKWFSIFYSMFVVIMFFLMVDAVANRQSRNK